MFGFILRISAAFNSHLNFFRVMNLIRFGLGNPHESSGICQRVYQYSPSPISRGLSKKRGLAIFPEEVNGEGVNKWKWVDFVLNRGVVNCWG